MATAAPEAPDLSSLPEALRSLAARGVPRSYRKGTLIIEEGSHGDTLYLLLRGKVRAFSSDARGREVTYGWNHCNGRPLKSSAGRRARDR